MPKTIPAHKTPKLFRFSLFVFASVLTLLIINFSLLIKSARAANAIPEPGRIPCDPNRVEDPEYSSGRPYQASPCGAPITYWCGNGVVVILGRVRVDYCDPDHGQADSCPVDPKIQVKNQKIDIDLTNVELPILGNTELTKNSQGPGDLDDGTKTSSYLAWYLGGVNNKAEYPIDPNTPEGHSRIVDFSGPVKKLLPSVIQEATRSAVINSALNKVDYIDTETEETVTDQAENHNQIVVCGTENTGGWFGWIKDVLNLGQTKPIDCYKGDGTKSQGKSYRLADWKGELSWWNDVANAAATVINSLVNLFPLIPPDIIEESIGNHWNSRLPPLPWCDKDCKPFASNALYQKAYNEWRGKTCILIPGVNLVICIDNIFVPNKYSDLFQYVPLANTVDQKGAHAIENVHIDAPLAVLESTDYSIVHSPQLYLAHSKENFQLTSLLKSTYLPADATGSSIPNDVETSLSSTCRIIPSRTNPGDDATFDVPKSHIEVDVSYTVSEIRCKNKRYECDDAGFCSWKANCSSDIYATINSVSKTPFAKEIWNNTVAANDSIFRRIYPQTGENSPVSCIADIPAQSKATYTVNSNSSGALNGGPIKIWRIVEPDDSGITGSGGASGSDTIDAQLYYPHYGGVLDYFLKGIQQALLPQGYGPGQPQSGQFCASNVACGELPELPKASGSCGLGGISPRIGNIPQSLKDIVEAAAETYKTPPNLILAAMYGEGAFNSAQGNSTGQGYVWTDENVKNWATCEPIPNCSGPESSVVGLSSQSVWDEIADAIKDDLKELDPNKGEPDPCNLLDMVYGISWTLSRSATGTSGFSGYQCFGINLNTGQSINTANTCSWAPEDYETSIRWWEFGAEFTPEYQCATQIDSCSLGGMGQGTSAVNCPANDNINCETITNRFYGRESHNGCLWDVGHGQ